MPYTRKQCRLFALLSNTKQVNKKGKVRKPPNDWKQHCRGKKRGKQS